jgi:hypothetical protein
MSPAVAPLQLWVMERPVVIEAADSGLRDTLAEAFADWRAERAADGPSIRLQLETVAASMGTPLRIEVEGRRLRLSGGGVEGQADADTLLASCRFQRQLAGEVADTLLLFLLTRSGRVPLHAAGVLVGRTAVVLAGPSGSGKSSLSLAAMARGLRILSDDTVYIQLQPRLRIWGFPRPVHVFPADAPGFTGRTRLRGGKLKAAVPIPAASEPPVAERAVVVLLERGEGIGLERIEPSATAAGLSRLEPGFDLLAEESARAIEALTADGGWRLTLGRDPAEALETLLAGLGLESGGAIA